MGFVWLQLIGQPHFQEVDGLPLATYAFERARVGPNAGIARYLLAWAYYRQDKYEKSIGEFIALLQDKNMARYDLSEESALRVAISIIDLWSLEAPTQSLLDRVRDRFVGQFHKPHVQLIFKHLIATTQGMGLSTKAAQLREFAAKTW